MPLVLCLIACLFLRRRRRHQKRSPATSAGGGDVFDGKPELPADKVETRLAEKDAEFHADRAEMPGTLHPPAELSSGVVDARTGNPFFAPHELPGDAPKRQELATEFNSRPSGAVAGGEDHHRDRDDLKGGGDSAVSNLSAVPSSRTAAETAEMSPAQTRNAEG